MDHGALVLFASATPSVESYQAALEAGRDTLYKLTRRYAGQPLPAVEMVDMRAELAAGNSGSISTALAGRIRQTLTRARRRSCCSIGGATKPWACAPAAGR